MPKNLHIFDVSPFLHAGHVNKASRLEQTIDVGTTWKTQYTPTGGTSLIINKIHEIPVNDDCVFCCDRNPTIKKEMLPTYKSNRHYDRGIEVEKAVAEYILQKCNCTVLARAGYEADDIIYSIVKAQHDAYDNIYVYTGDSDLYFLVDEVVSIKPSSARGKEINLYNYEYVLEKKGARYNTLTVQKILKGDSSDCIPALPKDLQICLGKILYTDEMYPHLGNKDFVRNWANFISPEAVAQVDLVFPLEVDDLPIDFNKPDRHAIRNFGAAINNKLYRGCGTPDFDIKPHIIELHNRGYYMEDNN